MTNGAPNVIIGRWRGRKPNNFSYSALMCEDYEGQPTRSYELESNEESLLFLKEIKEVPIPENSMWKRRSFVLLIRVYESNEAKEGKPCTKVPKFPLNVGWIYEEVV